MGVPPQGPLKLDKESLTALNRLSRALEHSNQLLIEAGREKQTEEAQRWATSAQIVHEMSREEILEKVRQQWPGAYLGRINLG